jgi:uncharacterized protein (UPF0332 family)
MMVIKDLFDCEYNKLLKKSPPNPEIINNEVHASDHDLASAKRDLGFDDHKWATVKAYYSMLHIANAVARSRGLIIENHHCVYLYLSRLADQKMLESNYAVGFRSIYDLRLKADYGLTYDRNTATDAIDIAQRFNIRLRSMVILETK